MSRSEPDVLLLPGLDGTGRLFEPLFAVLPPHIRAKAIAYPADETLELSALAALVLRQMPQEKVVLLAESFSGLVALELLESAPARIRGVIFVCAFAEPPRPFLLRLAPVAARSATLIRSTPAFLLRQCCLGSNATATQLERLREALASVSPEVLGQRLSLIAARHSFGKAPIDVPSCYIRASRDRLVPSHCATWFQRNIRHCAMQEIDGPHFLLQVRPREAADVIVNFMNGLRDD